jgi:hypothetical protein
MTTLNIDPRKLRSKAVTSWCRNGLAPSNSFWKLTLLLCACFGLLPNVYGGFGDTAYGYGANSASYGAYNSAFGYFALGSNDLATSNRGYYNVAVGYQVLAHNFYGGYNTAVGLQALFYNTDGSGSTAIGYRALFNHTNGNGNTATGYQALYSNSTGNFNTATGSLSLYSNVGYDNTALGYASLYLNKSGNDNTAAGTNALYYNNSGSFNVAAGSGALTANTSGSNNTAFGYQTLANNAGANSNTAVGSQALRSSTGGNNIAVGATAGANLTTGSDNIDIGAAGVAGESGRIRIGTAGKQTDTLIAGIFGKTITSGASVIIGSGGKLGTIQSSARFKKAIKPMEKASEDLLKLEPVTFQYKEELDPEGIQQFGLIAEQVEKVNPDLVVSDEDGNVTNVRYEAVNAMLLNEFLKEHRKVESQQTKIAELTSKLEAQQKQAAARFAQQQKQIDALADGLQKVSNRLELAKPAVQVAGNNNH